MIFPLWTLGLAAKLLDGGHRFPGMILVVIACAQYLLPFVLLVVILGWWALQVVGVVEKW